MKQENYQDLLSQFKVEELKERLEFDMAGAGWQGEVKPKIKPKGGNTSIYGLEPGVEKNIGSWK